MGKTQIKGGAKKHEVFNTYLNITISDYYY